MYLHYFGLNRSPFSIEPDPAFLWLGEKHQEGLSVLRYGILENKRFLLLTGDIGTGKTVLIRSLLTSLPGDVAVATIQDPSLTLLDFFNILSYELGMASTVDGKADFLIKFKKFVRRVYDSQKRLLVIIDEAQRLSNGLLDEIRVLSNVSYNNRDLLNFFFVGQIEFKQMLMDPDNKALRQRISVSYHLDPLNPEETSAYIRHRLKVAGTDKELFMREATHEIFKFSIGTPRLINILCDRALITGYSRDLNRVSPEMIRECAKELNIPTGAVASDFKYAPQVEKLPPIHKTADQAKAFISPFKIRRNWIVASGVSAVAFLLFWVFLTKAPENIRAEEPIFSENQSFEIRQPRNLDPKDSLPSGVFIKATPPVQNPSCPRSQQIAKQRPPSPLVNTATASGTLKKVNVTSQGNGIMVHMLVDGQVKSYKTFTIDDPPTAMIVVDLMGLSSAFRGEQKMSVEGSIVKRVRHFGHPEKVRVVVETYKAHLKDFSVVPVENGIILKVGVSTRKEN